MIIVVGPNTFSNVAYHDLLQSIKNKIKEGKFFLKDKTDKRSVLRIAIYSLGSPLWLPNKGSLYTINKSRDLDMFVFCLRALLRSALAVALISIPTRLYDEVIIYFLILYKEDLLVVISSTVEPPFNEVQKSRKKVCYRAILLIEILWAIYFWLLCVRSGNKNFFW